CTLNLHPVIPIVSTLRSRFFSLMFPPTPASPLFPYTTLFRSERSGHWSHYRQNMFLIESEGDTMSLKPMNCPGHFLMYASTTHSYRDLPIRFHEQTPLHRNEASGVLAGLTRVRQFSQDDAHCFITPEQIGEEVERLI